MLIDSRQLKAARALLGWDQPLLAKKSGVGVSTIRRLEITGGPMACAFSTVQKLQRCLEKAGIRLLNDGEPGVQLIKPRRTRRT